ncbi:MAG: hypothetical protein QOK49_2554 [Baekduia sp.]|nr:hypothetical protein [Baekduia sp.]
MRILRGPLRPSASMVVAFVALLVALGGTSYAVVRLPAQSVTAKHLKNGAVTRAKIKANAVDASKVAANSLTGADISEATLTEIPSAQTATRATASDRATTAANSDHASAAAAIDKLSYRTVKGTAPPAATIDQHGVGTASAACDAGQHVVGGGIKVDDPALTGLIDGYPDAGGTSWTARIDNPDVAAPHEFTVYAVCVTSVATG